MNERCPKCGAGIGNFVYGGAPCFSCANRVDGGGYAPGGDRDCIANQLVTERCAREKAEAEAERLRGADKAWQAAEGFKVRICGLLRLDYTLANDDEVIDTIGRLMRKTAEAAKEKP